MDFLDRGLTMRGLVAVALLIATAAAQAQELDSRSCMELVRKLGSSSFQERQKAVNILQDHPEAAAVLREAMRSAADPEVRKRAAQILVYHDRRPVRNLNVLAKGGDIKTFVE